MNKGQQRANSQSDCIFIKIAQRRKKKLIAYTQVEWRVATTFAVLLGLRPNNPPLPKALTSTPIVCLRLQGQPSQRVCISLMSICSLARAPLIFSQSLHTISRASGSGADWSPGGVCSEGYRDCLLFICLFIYTNPPPPPIPFSPNTPTANLPAPPFL